MNDNFDLNINNYTKKELIDILELPNVFTEKTIEEQIEKISKNILNSLDKQINSNSIIQFLNNTKKFLMEKKNSENVNNIIPNKKTEYINSYPNNYVDGVINQLKKRTIENYVNINSMFRNNFYTSLSSNYEITLPIKLKNIVQMRVTAFKLPIPNSFYNVSKQYKNNHFTICINNETAIINIPYGNYDKTSIIDAINVNLTSKGVPFSNINFSIDNNSMKTKIETNGDSSIETMSIKFYNENDINECGYTNLNQKQLGWLLGFKYPEYTNLLSYISESPVDLNAIKYLYLMIDDRNNNINNNFIGILKSSILNDNIIARISVNSLYNDENVVFDYDMGMVAPPRVYFGPTDIQYLKVKLTDEYGNVVDLNDMNFTFTLSIISIYEL